MADTIPPRRTDPPWGRNLEYQIALIAGPLLTFLAHRLRAQHQRHLPGEWSTVEIDLANQRWWVEMLRKNIARRVKSQYRRGANCRNLSDNILDAVEDEIEQEGLTEVWYGHPPDPSVLIV